MEHARLLPDSWLSLVASRLPRTIQELDQLVRSNPVIAEACMDYAECIGVLDQATKQSPVSLTRIQEYKYLESSIRNELLSLIGIDEPIPANDDNSSATDT